MRTWTQPLPYIDIARESEPLQRPAMHPVVGPVLSLRKHEETNRLTLLDRIVRLLNSVLLE